MTSMTETWLGQILCVVCAALLCIAGCGESDSDGPRTPSAGGPAGGGANADAGTADGGESDMNGGNDVEDSDNICSPGEEMGCDDGEFQICYQGERIDSFDCGADRCADGDRCGGDRCAAAIEVEAGTAGEPARVEGHRQAYGHSGLFDGLDGCDDEESAVADDAGDLFFAIDGIGDAAEVIVESAAQGSYTFYVLDGCDGQSCVHVQSVDGQAGDELANRIRWASTAGQDSVIVAARAGDAMDRPFEFEIYVEPN